MTKMLFNRFPATGPELIEKEQPGVRNVLKTNPAGDSQAVVRLNGGQRHAVIKDGIAIGTIGTACLYELNGRAARLVESIPYQEYRAARWNGLPPLI